MKPFFQSARPRLIDSPNGEMWWHGMPLPDGTRVSGAHTDKDLQFKMWEALKIPSDGGLKGRTVLDIGANDGFFSLAALKAGASKVVAVNTMDWNTWPRNITYASKAWGLSPEIVTADFRTYAFTQPFDVVFFFGVLYHLEDVFSCMRTLQRLLTPDGTLYVETQMSKLEGDLPLFEYASDIFQTVAQQDRDNLHAVGISNYLFPNEPAVKNLAYSYEFDCESLQGPHNRYTAENPTRKFYKMTKSRKSAARVA